MCVQCIRKERRVGVREGVHWVVKEKDYVWRMVEKGQ